MEDQIIKLLTFLEFLIHLIILSIGLVLFGFV